MPHLPICKGRSLITTTFRGILSRPANDSSSDENPLLTKILGKISALIRHIDSSMLVTQLGYQLASDALIFTDTEAKDWEADVTLDTLREIAGRAQEISVGVMEGFREIKQEVYKVCGLRYRVRRHIYNSGPISIR